MITKQNDFLLNRAQIGPISSKNNHKTSQVIAFLLLVGGAGATLATGQTTSAPVRSRHVFRLAPAGQTPRSVADISLADVQAANSHIVAPSGGGTITYTCDPSIDATAPGTCSYLNTTIAGIYGSTFSNANANIYIQFGITGLGLSDQYLNFFDYSTYRSALSANSSGDPVDVAALASLPSTEPSIFQGGQVNVTTALGTALGLTGLTGSDSSGNECTPGTSGCYNGVITITTPANLLSETGQTLYFRQNGGTQPFNSYDFYSIVEHETDELLGTSSCVVTSQPLSDGCGGTIASAVDLFRYQASGTRVFMSNTPGAYFSYNGGTTNVEVYNTLSNSDDYADWVTNCKHVQDAEGCPQAIIGGQGFDITNDGGVEITVLDAVGYNRVATTGGPTAAYLGSDISTKGNWTSNYGADGNIIANSEPAPPTYGTVTFTGDNTYTWSSTTTDPRALLTSLGSSTRIASAFYSSSSYSINVNLTDGKTHRVALYLLDWDGTTRAESIQILNAATGALLSSETYSGFHNGEYAAWNISGNVVIKVTKTGGSNAVVSGIFFDPMAGAAAATYVGLDTATQGNWTGKYGSNGEVIAKDINNVPAFATISLSGDSAFTWAWPTTDPRALQTASGASTRIASTYYASSSFDINVNLTDGKTHKISLYLLDWDSTTRVESIQVLNAQTNAVLDTRNYSSFHNGQYAAWNITGNVIIKVTKTTGSNAVVSGIFFD